MLSKECVIMISSTQPTEEAVVLVAERLAALARRALVSPDGQDLTAN